MQHSAQQNNILTPGSGLPYLLSSKEECKREGLLQRIHVRTSQKCLAAVKASLKMLVMILSVINARQLRQRCILEWWVDNKRYYL